MSDEDYKDMILQHDKHIEKLAIGIEHIAGAVDSTNKKLESIIDVISKQNILMEKFSNLETNSKEAFNRIRSEIQEIEHTHKHTGCNFVVDADKRIKKLEVNQGKIAWIVITAVVCAIMSFVLIKGS